MAKHRSRNRNRKRGKHMRSVLRLLPLIAATLAAFITVAPASQAAMAVHPAPPLLKVGSPIFTPDTAGYALTGGNFSNMNVSVFGNPVAGYSPYFPLGTGFGHELVLVNGTYTFTLSVSIFNGNTSLAPWDTAFDVTRTVGGAQVGSCLAGNPSGTGGVVCNNSVTGEPGAFVPGPIGLHLAYDPTSGLVSFSARNVTSADTLHGSFDAGPGLHNGFAEVASRVSSPSTITQPAASVLLGRFTSFTISTTNGAHGTLNNWTRHEVLGTLPGNDPLVTPNPPYSGGSAFIANLVR
jgi:hypothetical protein